MESIGNFTLDKKITSLDEFWFVINNHKSMYARDKMYPTAFFFSWPIRFIHIWIERGHMWSVIPNSQHSEVLKVRELTNLNFFFKKDGSRDAYRLNHVREGSKHLK